MQKKKKSERQKAVKALDTAFSEYIRERDKYQCYTCGTRGREKDGVMQCGHLITRGKYATRWNPLNAQCQCKSCNMRHEYQPEQYTSKWIEEHGEEQYLELVRESNSIRKFKISDLKEMTDMYRKATEELKNQFWPSVRLDDGRVVKHPVELS